MKELLNNKDFKEFTTEVTTSLYHFDKLILGYDKMNLDVHGDLCEMVNDRHTEIEGEEHKKFKLILMPRNTFKSTVVTIGYTLQNIVLNPNIRILIANELLDNAKRFLSEIKGHIERNQMFREFYGNLVGKKEWREDYFTVATRTKNRKEPTVSTAGVENVKVGMHYDLIICDDLVSDKNTGTKEQIDKVLAFYRLLHPMLEPDGKMIIIGTRWHFGDLYSHILENEQEKFNIMRRAAYKKNGSLLFPQRLTKQHLENEKRSLGSYLFACNYLNDPVDEETATFKQEWFKLYNPKDLGRIYPSIDDMNVYIHIDPAITQKRYGDYSGIVVTGVDYNDNVYVLYARHERLEVFQLIDRIFDLVRRYKKPLRTVLLETQVFQQAIKPFLYKEMHDRKVFFPIDEIKHTWKDHKYNRIRGLQPIFEDGKVFMVKDMTDLMDELVRFPKAKHEDLIDALSFGLGKWTKPTKEREVNNRPNTFDWFFKKYRTDRTKDGVIGEENIGNRRNYGINI